MSLRTWLAGLLRGAPMGRYEEARVKTDEVAEAARELNRKLEPYTHADDPFRALMVDLYNRRDEVLHMPRELRR